MDTGFVGAGKVGFSLGKYMKDKGVSLMGYASRSRASAHGASVFTESCAFDGLEELLSRCDCVFLTVPDDAIGAVWNQLRQCDISGKIICHCSGSLSSGIFEGASECGASVCSLHPLMALPDCYHSHALLHEAVFALEGDTEACAALQRLITSCGNAVYLLDKDKKALYHCAAVFVSNFSTALAYIGAEMFKTCGMEEATEPLFQLMLHNARSVSEFGVTRALTGPVERCDVRTVSRHLSCLPADDRELYTALSRKLVAIASGKHVDRDYSPVLALLDEKKI